MLQDTSKTSLELLYHISRELVSSLSLKTVLSRILLLSTSALEAERGFLIALNEHQAPIAAALVYNNQVTSSSISDVQGILDHGLAGWVIKNQKPALVPDTSQDNRWLKRPDDEINASGAKSALCIPILMGNEQLVGILTVVHPQPGFFNEDHFSLLQAIADQAGVAIYNALLHENLQAAHLRYHELFEDNIDPIFITDWRGAILEANRKAAAVTGFDQVELPQHNIHEIHKTDLTVLSEKNENLHAGETVRFESILTPRFGEQFPVEIFTRKVTIEGGEYLQWIMRDISERKALETLKEDLIAMVYHDLRSPLSNVISGLDMLKVLISPDDHSTIEPIINIIFRSVERLQRLVSSLLDTNRLESGQKITRESATHINALVNEAVEVILPNTESKKQQVKIDIPADIPDTIIDVEMIRRVLINLLENAVKFTPNNGTISIGASHEDPWVKIWVQDSGSGIPSEAHETIFNKFTRLQNVGGPKGLGLGLAFCRLAVQAHGGKIWVESPLDGGARFIFTVPVKEQ